MKYKFDKINRCYYTHYSKINNMNYKIIISTIFFKFNNVFITVSKFNKYGDLFIFLTILKSLSCGQFKRTYTACNKIYKTKKLSVLTINKLINKFIIFLVYNGNCDIHIIFKNKSYYKKTLLFLFIKFHILKGIYLCTVSNILNYPYNGCRLKKRKFK